ncbi:flagellar biosynthesis protein FliR [bacterium BMS3Bbin06]|nr:flagellar biosynthesis protein FliR [bacterium BMS3Abin08]GBE33822.1 flagellar biosynthesis protein FliR [bacterium BMS3Bbin06]HDO35758.1 type III secretion protein [Nitrospirota bacterium]HDY72050.1 type III secretion protein [Nitrospirota bacterium]
MKSYDIPAEMVITFVLVLIRLSMIMALLPVFGSKTLPPLFKIGLIVAISMALTPVVSVSYNGDDLLITVIRELILSFVLALSVRFVFYAIDTAGQVISTTTGLAMANVFNPEIGQSTEIARIYGIIAVLTFLSLNAHHYFIYAFIKSFELIPFGGANVREMLKVGIMLSGRIFIIALKLSAPFITVVMITNILMGILYKLIPQFNIFFVGYPIYISLGFFLMMILTPVVVFVLSGYFMDLKGILNAVILAGAKPR